MRTATTAPPTEGGTFDFGEAIRQALRDNPKAARGDIAKLVAAQIPRRDHVRVIEALLLYPIDEMARLGQTAPRPLQPAVPESHGAPKRHEMERRPAKPEDRQAGYVPDWSTPTPSPRPAAPVYEPLRHVHVPPRSGPVTVRQGEPIKPAAPSRWTGPAGITALYTRWLNTPVKVGDAMKRQKDCTKDDIRVLAAGCRADAGRYDRLLDAMRRKRAATVGDLSEPVIAEIMQWQ